MVEHSAQLIVFDVLYANLRDLSFVRLDMLSKQVVDSLVELDLLAKDGENDE